MARLDRPAICLLALAGADLGRSPRQGAPRGGAVRRLRRRSRRSLSSRRAAPRATDVAARYRPVYSGLALLYRAVGTAGHGALLALLATARSLTAAASRPD